VVQEGRVGAMEGRVGAPMRWRSAVGAPRGGLRSVFGERSANLLGVVCWLALALLCSLLVAPGAAGATRGLDLGVTDGMFNATDADQSWLQDALRSGRRDRPPRGQMGQRGSDASTKRRRSERPGVSLSRGRWGYPGRDQPAAHGRQREPADLPSTATSTP